MIKLVLRFVTLATFLMALIAAPSLTPAFAAGGGGVEEVVVGPFFHDLLGPFLPAFVVPEAVGHQSCPQDQKTAQQSSIDDPAFSQGYRAAYATIYDRNDFAAAIEQLKALGHDGHPNVANMIGYSYRKLGDYKLSQVWYEARRANPNHVLT